MKEAIERIESKLISGRAFFVRLVAETLVSGMKVVCAKCQEDKMRCALDPMCKNRNYLSILIESGVNKEDLPQTCFRFRLAEIQKFYMRKPIPVSLDDAKMYLEDFFRVFRIKAKDIDTAVEKLAEYLKKYWDDVRVKKLMSGKIVLILNKGEVVTVFDPQAKLVNINSKEDGLEEEEVIEVLKFISEVNGLSLKVTVPYPGRVILVIKTNGKKPTRQSTRVMSSLKRAGRHAHVFQDGDVSGIVMEAKKVGELLRLGDLPTIIIEFAQSLK